MKQHMGPDTPIVLHPTRHVPRGSARRGGRGVPWAMHLMMGYDYDSTRYALVFITV